MIQKPTTDEIVNALVDGEIDADEAASLLDHPDTARRAQELRRISQEIRLAYKDVKATPLLDVGHRNKPLINLAAAILVLVTGLLLGFFFRDLVAGPKKHLLLHVTDGSDVAITAAMNTIERNLANGVSVDLMTQRQGLALVSIDSPVAAQLRRLAASHPDFEIFACAGTLEKLRARGAAPALIAETRIDSYAIDRVSYAYQHRWRYERI